MPEIKIDADLQPLVEEVARKEGKTPSTVVSEAIKELAKKYNVTT